MSDGGDTCQFCGNLDLCVDIWTGPQRAQVEKKFGVPIGTLGGNCSRICYPCLYETSLYKAMHAAIYNWRRKHESLWGLR